MSNPNNRLGINNNNAASASENVGVPSKGAKKSAVPSTSTQQNNINYENKIKNALKPYLTPKWGRKPKWYQEIENYYGNNYEKIYNALMVHLKYSDWRIFILFDKLQLLPNNLNNTRIKTLNTQIVNYITQVFGNKIRPKATDGKVRFSEVERNIINTTHLRRYIISVTNYILSKNISSENKGLYIDKLVSNTNKDDFYKGLININNIQDLLKYIVDFFNNRMKRDTNKTSSTMITHILGPKLNTYNPGNQRLKRVHNSSKRSGMIDPRLDIEFNKIQTRKFKRLFLKDIIHDNDYEKYEITNDNLSNILSSFGFKNSNISNLNITGKYEQIIKKRDGKKFNIKYSKSKVDDESKRAVSNFFSSKNTIKLKIPLLKNHIQKNGKNLIRYRTTNGKFYKTFNLLLDSNTNATINKFVKSLYLTKNRKIASHILCPAQLLNAGSSLSSVSPIGVLLAKINEYNDKNVVVLNSRRLNVTLKFDEGNNETIIILKIAFNPSSRKFVLQKKEIIIETTTAKQAINVNSKVSKFLGDFMMILKVISDSKRSKKPIAYGTTDNHSVLIYKFLCEVSGVKPRIFFTRKEEGYNELYIHGMNDIISKQCELTTKKNRERRKRNTINANKRGNNGNNSNINVSASNNSNNNNRNR